ncbi:hypothetical protein POM88_027037 [Heracleum sosnowskyi]|uniref:Uncharacterized protein n=1 Tax=Heracleum sosnowskyi TaxID=360622 RepID=A0AAD8I9D2_9APIA|nr:hypothetical protein POM88_027037 [Heracleum sosnowskyi]
MEPPLPFFCLYPVNREIEELDIDLSSLLQMSSEITYAGSQQSIVDENQPTTRSLLKSFSVPPFTVSSRTCSKVTVIDPYEAQIALKAIQEAFVALSIEPLALNWTTSEEVEEVQPLNFFTDTQNIEIDSHVPQTDENQDNEATKTNPPLIEAAPTQLSYMYIQTPLKGTKLRRAEQVLELCAGLGGGSSLLTTKKLVELRFTHEGNPEIQVDVGNPEEGTHVNQDMSFSVPSSIKKSLRPSSRKGSQETEAPTPIPSKVQGASASIDKTTSSKKRDFQQTPGASHASGSLSKKRIKQITLKSPQSSVYVTSKSRFLESVNDNVSDNSVFEWDKMSLVEVAPVVTSTSSQCLFFSLKYGSQIVEVVQGDARLCEEIAQLRAESKAWKDEKGKLLESNKALFNSESALIKERKMLLKDREKHDLIVRKLDKGMEDLEDTYTKKLRDLKAQVKALKASTTVPHPSRLDEDPYDTGYASGIRDYMASTYEVFPNLEWALLGQDVVDAVERIKRENVVVVDKGKVLFPIM